MSHLYPRRMVDPIRTLEQSNNIRQQLSQDILKFKRAGGKVYFAAVGESALPDRPLTYKELSRLEREARLKGAR
jgi:hypothetical protein